jgi:formylmethanofuran dehydrogenase subunit B
MLTRNAVCTFCGCTCDDIDLTTEHNRITKVKRACSLGEAWFLHHGAADDLPAALVGGQPTELDVALEEAAAILDRAVYPLVYGLSNSTCEAQREAVALAELIGGVIDSHTSI